MWVDRVYEAMVYLHRRPLPLLLLPDLLLAPRCLLSVDH